MLTVVLVKWLNINAPKPEPLELFGGVVILLLAFAYDILMVIGVWYALGGSQL